MKKSEIFFRRQQVWDLFTQGYDQIKIAEKLKVSYKTITRDLQALKREATDWMDDLHKGEIQLQQKKNFDSLQKVSNELWKIFESTEDADKKLKILNHISQNSKLQDNMANDHVWNARELIYSERYHRTNNKVYWGTRKSYDKFYEQNVRQEDSISARLRSNLS